jgi:hypothetical protein
MAIKTYEAFKAPSPYEQERLRAERQRRYAELLEQQAMEPESEFTYQGIRAMPSPAAALGKLLSAYQGKKAREKAEEAEARKTGMEEEASRQIMNRLIGGRPVTDANTTPDEFGLAEIATEAKYTVSPELTAEAMRMAMTPQGVGAMRGNPMLAAALQKSMEAPAGDFGTNVEYDESGNAYVVNKRTGQKQYTGAKKPEEAAKPVTRIGSEDLGDRVRTYFSDGSSKDTPKGLAPTAPKEEKQQTASEGERKDAYNLGRVVTAANQIQNATKTEPQSVRPGFGEAAIGMLPFGIGEDIKYRAQSPQRQIIDSAQTDLIDAALTLATGAAYTKEQLAGQVRSLIPRYGESDESIAAKDARLRELMSNAKVRAGRAWTPELDAQLAKLFPALQQKEEVIKLPPRPR